jgi:outer membrane protein assembly factor BamB
MTLISSAKQELERKNRMKTKSLNKQLLSLILTLAFAMSLISAVDLTFSNAQVTGASGVTSKAYAYTAVMPRIAGVGETVFITGWVCPPPWTVGARFYNFTFTVTKPDKSTETKFFNQSDTTATASYSYQCYQAGTYSVALTWPGDTLHPLVVTVPFSWTVKEDYTTPTYQTEPLPTGSWKYPISAEYYEWYQISGGWLWAGQRLGYDVSNTNFNPYTKGPNTSHILYRLQEDIGGLMGGSAGYEPAVPATGGRSTGTAFWNNLQPVSANGRVYFTTTEGYTTNSTLTTIHPVIHCVDQFTGEEIYARDLPIDGKTPGTSGGASGIALQYTPFNKYGSGVKYALNLWISGGGLWQVNAFTGDCLYYMSLPSGCVGLYSEDSWYLHNYPLRGNLTRWDTFTKRALYTVWDPITWVYGWSPGKTVINADPHVIVEPDNEQQQMYFKVRDCDTGALLGEYKYDIASAQKPGTLYNGVLYWLCIDEKIHGFSITTGREVWVSEAAGDPLASFGTYWSSNAYGMVYFGSWDGYMRAYDAGTGKLVWEFFTGITTETATGSYIPWGNAVLADGKMYFATGEHTPPSPLPRGNKLFCLDAFTGEFKWSYPLMSGYGGISSGMLYYRNNYDGCLYMFGKGPSAVTVTTGPKIIANGAATLIEGTVTDQSSGAKDTPAIADESQSEWMEYIYNNAPMPTNATGVTVFLQAVRSNGTVIDLWHVKSDIMGHFEYAWTPSDQDTYKILATFEGSDSYWSSSAETAVSVGPTAEQFNIPSASQIADQVISQLPTPIPATPSPTPAAIVTPTPYTASDIAQQVLYQLPAISSTDAILIAAVALVAVLGIATLLSVRKIKKD